MILMGLQVFLENGRAAAISIKAIRKYIPESNHTVFIESKYAKIFSVKAQVYSFPPSHSGNKKALG